MPIEVTMPRLSDTMQQGTIVKWNVKEGQKVKTGDTIADIETDKATMELQSFDDGTVAKILVPQGQQVAVGTLMMVLATQGEDAASVAANAKAGTPARAQQAAGASGGAAAKGGTTVLDAPTSHANGRPPTSGNDRVFASPLARKIADEAGLDLSRVHGSGPGGRIVRKDVEEAMAGAPGSPALRAGPSTRPSTPSMLAPTPAPEGRGTKRIPVSTMRRIIAQRLAESKGTIPHYQVTFDVDMQPLMALRTQLNDQLAQQGVKLSVNDFLVRACALAMLQHPYINSRWSEGALSASSGSNSATPEIEYLPAINVGVAIALPVHDDGTGGGLVVATLRNADQMGLRQISAQTKALSEKARAKGLAPNEMSDATFTISNLGMFGVAHFNAIINPPNTAILAVGAAIEKPVVKNGHVVPGLVMSMTMSSDHRVIDGAMAAQYLSTVKAYLEKPATLLV
jgi:pyruvate dehydrogenase E2 component (dihydrolipoamide acetyltransferase)